MALKRILVMLGIGKHYETMSVTETMSVPETMVDAEIVRLTRCTPQTKAEKEFHKWLVDWKQKQEG
jgi:hypothetical protein